MKNLKLKERNALLEQLQIARSGLCKEDYNKGLQALSFLIIEYQSECPEGLFLYRMPEIQEFLIQSEVMSKLLTEREYPLQGLPPST